MEDILSMVQLGSSALPIWGWFVAGAVLLTGLISLSWKWWRHPHRQLKRKLKKLGAQILSDVRLPDGLDGEICIDYLVLTEKGILIIDVKRYDGLIYGSENHDEWTQVVKRRNYVFANPLQQMSMRIMAVKSVVPEADVEGAVLFAGRGHFPKRVPQGVIMLEDLPVQRAKSSVPEHIQLAWQQLSQHQAHY